MFALQWAGTAARQPVPVPTLRGRAKKALDPWCDMAAEVDHPDRQRFIGRLRFLEYGILNHGDDPIGTRPLEGVNNKIKVIQRKAYGFHDPEYFALKIKQALPGRETVTETGWEPEKTRGVHTMELHDEPTPTGMTGHSFTFPKDPPVQDLLSGIYAQDVYLAGARQGGIGDTSMRVGTLIVNTVGLPPEGWIWVNGNVDGVSFLSYNGATEPLVGFVHWVPEPASALLLGLGAVSVLRRRRP